MKKYLVNNVYINAASANDAVKKYKLINTANDAIKIKDVSKQEVERAINNLGYKVKKWTEYAGDVSAIVDPADVNKDGYAYFNKQVKKLKQYANDVYADDNEIVFFRAKFSIKDSVEDSDKLAQMAYKFAQMGNYFDRANSANSRRILAKEDDKKYIEFYNFALQVYQQLKTEVEGAKKNAIPKRYRLSYDNQTLKLLDDGASRLYWAADNMNDRKGDLLSKKIRELAKEYKNATYDSVKDAPDMETISGRQSYYLQQIMAAIDILDPRMWNHAGTKVNVDNNSITLLAMSDGIKIINAKTGKTIIAKSRKEVEDYLRQNVN